MNPTVITSGEVFYLDSDVIIVCKLPKNPPRDPNHFVDASTIFVVVDAHALFLTHLTPQFCGVEHIT
jgi:hypothetical protein